MSSYPTVRLNELVKDQCNFTDETFSRFVTEWMNRMMPGFPLGLLETAYNEGGYERWEVEPAEVFEVETYKLWEARCADYDECGAEFYERYRDERPEGQTCPDCGKAALEFGFEEVYVIRDTNYVQDAYVEWHYVKYDKPDGETQDGWAFWDDQDEAASEAREQDAEYANESGYGFPWANSWAYIPDKYVSTEDLKSAGFVVATYRGGDGDHYRLCGIDGGGYSFKGQHFAKLVALHQERNAVTVPTDGGPAYITTDYRTLSEQLAADSTEQIQG